jgi:hypothetical protein
MLYQGHSIVSIERGTKSGEYWRFQLAVDGVPCIPFDVHDADIRAFRNQELLEQFLARQAISLIENYGDSRFAVSRSKSVGTCLTT